VIVHDIVQPTHLLLLLVVALFVLGPKRLPSAAKSLGKGMHDFRNALSMSTEDKPAKSPAASGGPAD
jgi:sec-independent protein translocase protein TatA